VRKEDQKNPKNSRTAGHRDKAGREHPDADAARLKIMWEIL